MEPVTYNINLSGLEDLTTPAATAAVGGVLGFMLAAGAAIGILLIIAWWRIFEKAGEKGWKALIPIYNGYILFKICGAKNLFWIFLGVSIFASVLMGIDIPATQDITVNFMGSQIQTTGTIDINWAEHIPYLIGILIECASAIGISVFLSIKLGRAFKKGVGFQLGLIFLSAIFYMILGFGKAKYDKSIQKED